MQLNYVIKNALKKNKIKIPVKIGPRQPISPGFRQLSAAEAHIGTRVRHAGGTRAAALSQQTCAWGVLKKLHALLTTRDAHIA